MILKLTGKFRKLNAGTDPSAMLLFRSCCGLVRDWPELNPYIALPVRKEAEGREVPRCAEEKRFPFSFISGLKDITNDH